MRRRSLLPLCGFAITTAIVLGQLTIGCGDDSSQNGNGGVPPGATADGGTEGGPNGPLTIAPGPSRGSAIATSADDSVVVAVNRDASSVSVFKATYPDDGSTPKLERTAEVQVGGEPWQVVISPDGDTAYVVLRKDQKLVKIGGLKGTPAVAGSVAVGSEPTGVALTPGGSRAWVANWVDGTLMGVDTAKMEVGSTVDLNAALVATNLLGTEATARPAVAHPRSVAITNNGDANESDETIYVTEYYAQRTEAEAADGANADTAKSGLVYAIKIADKSVKTIKLAAIADMGFKDSNGAQAGCYPNQLQSITIQDHFAYVSSVCASPKGPVGVVTTPTVNTANVKTTTHGAVSVIDLTTDTEVTAATASLHGKFGAEFDARKLAEDGTRRYPAVPSDVGFVKGGGVAYVVANASDAVFRVRYDVAAGGAITELGTPSQAFINLNPAGIPAAASGQNPIGIAMPNQDAHKRYAYVANDITRNVQVIDFNQQTVAGASAADAAFVQSSALPADGTPEDSIRKGKRFFNTATGRWSLAGQGWNGCQSCHVDGLSDNVTWYFARGPRQSTSLDGTFSKKDSSDQRLLNWTAINDELSDFEGNTRGISGGVGGIAKAKPTPPAGPTNADRVDPSLGGAAFGLVGSIEDVQNRSNPLALAEPNVLPDWENIKAYVQHIRSPKKPSNLDQAKVAAGKTLFQGDGSCQGCHGGDKWTISKKFYSSSAATMTSLATKPWTAPTGFPVALLPAADQRFMRFNSTAAFDQLQCILRPVGTFNVADGLMTNGAELRQDMTTPGQGNEVNGNGYNPPSLLGVSVGAPFFHAGGAATLESLFSPTFKTHYQALAGNLFTEADPAARAAKVDQMVQYLLSIDEDAEVIGSPTTPGIQGGNFCSVE